MSEQFSPWMPLPNLKGSFSLDQLRYDGEELYLRLISDSDRALEVKVGFPLNFNFLECDNEDFDADLSFGPFWIDTKDGSSIYRIFLSDHGFLTFETEVEPHVSWVDNFFGDAV